MFYYDVASFNVAEVPEPFNQGFEIGPLFLGTASVPKHSDYRNSSRLLRARRERPRYRRAADKADELTPSLIEFHSVPSHRAGLQNIGLVRISQGASVRLDAGELDHLAPLLGFLGDELAEVGR